MPGGAGAGPGPGVAPGAEDPPGGARNHSELTLRQLLIEGHVRAIMGERTVDPTGVRTVIPDAEAAFMALDVVVSA